MNYDGEDYIKEKERIKKKVGRHILYVRGCEKWSLEQMNIVLSNMSDEGLEWVIRQPQGRFYDEYTELARTIFFERHVLLSGVYDEA